MNCEVCRFWVADEDSTDHSDLQVTPTPRRGECRYRRAYIDVRVCIHGE